MGCSNGAYESISMDLAGLEAAPVPEFSTFLLVFWGLAGLAGVAGHSRMRCSRPNCLLDR